MGTPPKAIIEKVSLLDSLTNLISSLGTGSDKRAHSRFINTQHLSRKGNEQQLSDMYRTDWLSGKVVDIVPNDMTREWRSFRSNDMTPEILETLEKEEALLQLQANFNFTHKLARLYGTAFIVMAIEDGQKQDMPLNIEAIKPGGLKYINSIDRHRITVKDPKPIADPLDPDFGMPEYYRFNETNVVIHHSRLIRFDAIRLPYDEFRRNNFMSDSVLDRLYDSIVDFCTVTQGTSSMVYDTNVDVISVKNFMQLIQSPEGEALLRKRFNLAKVMKSFNNMLLLDQEEQYEIKARTFSGLPDLIDRYAHILSAATDIPATRLLGSSAQGLSATGEGDMRNYYDMIASIQESLYRPKLIYFDKIMAKSLGIGDDVNLDFEFNALYQQTEKEQADTEYVNAQRDQIYINLGVIPEHTVTKELQQNGIYTNIDDEYIEELENAFELEPTTPPIEATPEEATSIEGGEGTQVGGGEVS